MDLHPRQIRAFVSVARLQSFTGAATALHVSQPAMTVLIRKLEDALKVRLFDRTSRSVTLTSAGEELLPALERYLSELDSLVADTHDKSAGRRGIVRIACLPSFAASLLPVVIRECRERRPLWKFIVRDAVASRVVELVNGVDVDLGITGGDVSMVGLDLLFEGHDRLCLVLPSDHKLARSKRLTMDDIVELPLVLTDQATSIRGVVEAAFRARGATPHVACETTYMMTAVAMVQSGLGMTILPGSAREPRGVPGLVSRPIHDPAFVRRVRLIKKSRRTLSATCQEFASKCIAAMKEQQKEDRRRK
ncbi:MAG: LysR family transcriptional regulator [Caldimonas sp.]